MIGQNILELDRTDRHHWAGLFPTGGWRIQPRELQLPASFLRSLFSYCYSSLYDSYIQYENGEGALDASSDQKSAVQQVDRDAIVEEPERQCDVIRCRPVESAVAAPAVESFSNFAPDSGLSPFLTLEKIIQLQIGRSNSVDLLFLFCFKKQLSKKKTCSTILAK